MHMVNLATLILLILGGLDLLFVGLFLVDPIMVAFGQDSSLSRIFFTLVGIAAIWQIIPLMRSIGNREEYGERDEGP